MCKRFGFISVLSLIFFLVFMVCSTYKTCAQSNNALYSFNQAKQSYDNGLFNKTIQLLTANMKYYIGSTKTEALRLQALSYLYLDDYTNAEASVITLLQNRPDYTIALDDPARFAEMIMKNRNGEIQVITASQQSETVNEVPVPVTVITQNMIKASSARTLQDVLITYVPSMTKIESEVVDNVSMRGIYGNDQHSILIMRDGQRYNSYYTNAMSLGPSISLANIKQIEVLRGPASSLYGNVALTAVVNVITKDGNDVNGLQAEESVGNKGQLATDILFGKRILDFNILAWFSMYHSDGEQVVNHEENYYKISPFHEDGKIYVGGYKDNPTHDLGLKLEYKNWRLDFAQLFLKKIPPYDYNNMTYTYSKYGKMDGMKLGYSQSPIHAKVSYGKKLKDVMLNLSGTFCRNNERDYEVLGDSLKDEPTAIHSGCDYLGATEYLNCIGETYEFEGKMSYDYHLASSFHGNILGGAQFSSFRVKSYANNKYYGYDLFQPYELDNSDSEKMSLGKDNSSSVYLQVKNYFSKKLIFNIGIRYDHKVRKDTATVKSFSPRLALIYHDKGFTYKLSCSRAFADDSYNRIDESYLIYGEGRSLLKPEYLNSYQLSLKKEFINPKLILEANIYYNIGNKLFNNNNYSSSGKVKLMGVELFSHYDMSRILINWNLTWQHLLSSHNYYGYHHQMQNTPSFESKFTSCYKIFVHKNSSLWTNLNLKYSSIRKSVLSSSDGPVVLSIPAVFLCDTSLDYKYYSWEAYLTIQNIMDKSYVLDGIYPLHTPIPQLGRVCMLSLSYRF